jgi:predicted permease
MKTLFAWLLRLLPRDVRTRYALDMRRTFRRRLADARRQGSPAVIRAAAREYVDLARAAVTSRRRNPMAGGATMAVPEPVRRGSAVSGLALDVRFAWRLLRRAPGFTTVAIVTLAIGIGANAAIFSVIYGVVLAPLPYPDSHRIVALFYTTPTGSRGTHSPVALLDYEQRSRVFAAIGIYDSQPVVLTGQGEAARLAGTLVTPAFFDVLGLRAAQGRLLQPADRLVATDVVVISHRLWRSRLGSGEVLGTRIRLDGQLREIVGVMPPETAFPAETDVWMPLVFSPDDLRPNQRGAHYVEAIARLRDGIDIEAAQQDVDRVSAGLAQEYPNYHEDTTLAVVPLIDAQTENVSLILQILLGAVVLVLLVACSNVANLLLSRATRRHGEVAVRASLGAGRARLARQFVVESLMLAAAGGAAGLLLASWTLRPLLALAPADLPRAADIGLHLPVVFFTLGVATLCGLAFGLVPAFGVTRRDLVSAINEGGGQRTVGRSRGRAQRALAIGQLALALVLVTGSILLLRTLDNLQRVEPGFDPSNLLTFRLTLPATTYGEPSLVLARYRELLDELSRIPGVTHTGMALGAPFSRRNPVTSFELPAAPTDAEQVTSMRVIGGDYFQTLRVPLVEGRLFDARDSEAGQLVALVNQAWVRRFTNGTSPIGQPIELNASLTGGAPRGDRTIVGVVGDVRQRSLSGEPEPDVFIPYAQHPVETALFLVRTSGDPGFVAGPVRERLRALDADLPLWELATMEELIGATTAARRFTSLLLGVFAATAVLLAAVGLYSVLAYDVTQRTREIGVRMALGADAASVLRLFLHDGVRVGVAGAALGLVGTLAFGGVIESLLFDVRHRDPLALSAAAAAVLLLAVLASLLPARRATRLDPVRALRN